MIQPLIMNGESIKSISQRLKGRIWSELQVNYLKRILLGVRNMDQSNHIAAMSIWSSKSWNWKPAYRHSWIRDYVLCRQYYRLVNHCYTHNLSSYKLGLFDGSHCGSENEFLASYGIKSKNDNQTLVSNIFLSSPLSIFPDGSFNFCEFIFLPFSITS